MQVKPRAKHFTNKSFKKFNTYSIILASISMLRMFGFFLLMPILSYLASKMQNSTPFTIGLALGIYGLVQAFFYFPLGIVSDKFGRKPIIYLGLCLLLIGSLIATISNNIYILIIARSIQGIGAISAVLSAYMADIIPSQYRTKSMMFIGIGVGISFPLSLIISPLLYNNFGTNGIFYTVAISSTLAMICVLFLPNPKQNTIYLNSKNIKQTIQSILYNKNMQPWFIGVIFLHILSMMFFYLISFILESKGISLANQWLFYLPILCISFIFSARIIKFFEKKLQFERISLISISFMFISYLGFILTNHSKIEVFSIFALSYFIGFNILEIFQPSILSKLSVHNIKGATMGIYYTLQSLGMFLGSIIAGIAGKISYTYNFDKNILIFSISLSFVILWACYSIKYNKINLNNSKEEL